MICPPISCCCKGPVMIGPGEVQPLTLAWDNWLNSSGMGGFTLASVASAALMDYAVNPPRPADPARIKIVSGLLNDPTPGDNADAGALLNLMPTHRVVQVFVDVADTAAIGSQYRLNVCVVARDCDGRRARMCDCVMIVVADC